MKLFLQKHAKFSSAGGKALRPPCLWRLGAEPPDPPNSPPIANFWLRAWQHKEQNKAMQSLVMIAKSGYFCYAYSEIEIDFLIWKFG